MGNRKELVMFVSVLSLVFSMTTQCVVFDNNKVLASALNYGRNYAEKSTLNNLEQSSTITQQSYYNTNEASSKNSALLSTANTNKSTNLRTIFKQVENSVVQITSKLPIPASNGLNPQSPNTTALGSGFVYDNQGHIITNGHVVGDSKIVDVTFVDGNRYTAQVIGTDIYGDIAVLQILQNTTQQRQLLSSLKPLVIGNSSNLEVGDQVIALGNPFGLSDTMT